MSVDRDDAGFDHAGSRWSDVRWAAIDEQLTDIDYGGACRIGDLRQPGQRKPYTDRQGVDVGTDGTTDECRDRALGRCGGNLIVNDTSAMITVGGRTLKIDPTGRTASTASWIVDSRAVDGLPEPSSTVTTNLPMNGCTNGVEIFLDRVIQALLNAADRVTHGKWCGAGAARNEIAEPAPECIVSLGIQPVLEGIRIADGVYAGHSRCKQGNSASLHIA